MSDADAERQKKLVELRGYYDDWRMAKRNLDNADWAIDCLEKELFGELSKDHRVSHPESDTATD